MTPKKLRSRKSATGGFSVAIPSTTAVATVKIRMSPPSTRRATPMSSQVLASPSEIERDSVRMHADRAGDQQVDGQPAGRARGRGREVEDPRPRPAGA